jgi:hypothetical protein
VLQDRFEALFEVMASEHDAPSTGLALQTDVRADTGDLPVETAAGVRLAHTYDIADVDGDGHDGFSGHDYTK